VVLSSCSLANTDSPAAGSLGHHARGTLVIATLRVQAILVHKLSSLVSVLDIQIHVPYHFPTSNLRRFAFSRTCRSLKGVNRVPLSPHPTLVFLLPFPTPIGPPVPEGMTRAGNGVCDAVRRLLRSGKTTSSDGAGEFVLVVGADRRPKATCPAVLGVLMVPHPSSCLGPAA